MNQDHIGSLRGRATGEAHDADGGFEQIRFFFPLASQEKAIPLIWCGFASARLGWHIKQPTRDCAVLSVPKKGLENRSVYVGGNGNTPAMLHFLQDAVDQRQVAWSVR